MIFINNLKLYYNFEKKTVPFKKPRDTSKQKA